MPIDADLHLYLDRCPTSEEATALLDALGFRFLKEEGPTKVEPLSTHWQWKNAPLSEAGFKLVLFEEVCTDDLYHGQYEAFTIISGSQDSSPTDLTMIDITTHLLLSRYGGRLHNPYKINKISTDIFLSGIENMMFLK